jgi:hypothetical protein
MAILKNLKGAHRWSGQTIAAIATLAKPTMNDGYSRKRNHPNLVIISDFGSRDVMKRMCPD